ncbi:MAG: hypothetical protein QOF43_1673 [Gaiellaceae bacterium]|nr:hypothetical protein [Gaiellaceae bacterium]
MSGGRLAGVGAGVVGLLVVAGVASHGRPLSGGRGRGPTAPFFDYVATTLIVFAIAIVGIVVYALCTERSSWVRAERRRTSLLSGLIAIAGAILLSLLILHSGFEKRLQKAAGNLSKQPAAQGRDAIPGGKNVRNARIRWDEIAVVAVLVGGTAIVLFARRNTKRTLRPLRFARREAIVSDALDDSLEDLQNDPDLRRAIIAAYARMEAALARAGLPRHPSEAPFEYVERALGTLDLDLAAVERLTSLFEWAKFSQHEPGPEMRDEAITALVAVRDELRRPTEEPVPA